MNEYLVDKTNCMLRYHDFPGDDMPILFIHGLGCAGSFDYPQVAAQEALKNHRCILIDLLGAGYSDKPDRFGYTVQEHAEYLVEFIDFLKMDFFILYGHSLGGAVALALADICRDRIQRIVLSESNLDKSAEGSTSKLISSFDAQDFIDLGFNKLVEKSRARGNGMWAASLSLCSPLAVYLISESAAKGGDPSWRQVLYSLECPKTFIYGENSLPDPDMRILSEHGINIEIVKHAGHSMAWENPKGLAEAIRKGIQYDLSGGHR